MWDLSPSRSPTGLAVPEYIYTRKLSLKWMGVKVANQARFPISSDIAEQARPAIMRVFCVRTRTEMKLNCKRLSAARVWMKVKSSLL